MQAQVGDRIAIETERVGQHEREGEILEIRDSALGREYRVLWDDGRVTEIRPKAGSARIVEVMGSRPTAG